MLKKFIPIFLILTTTLAFARGRIQNEDVKSSADIRSSALITTGNLVSGSSCISSPASTLNLSLGLYVYDTTTPSSVPAGTTIIGLPGSCSVGQIKMSANAAASGSGETLTFGGQDSQLPNDSKIWLSSLTETLAAAIANGDVGGSRAYNIRPESGSSYTFVISDGFSSGRFPLVTANSATGQLYTLPAHSSVAFPVGEKIDIAQLGAGSVEVLPAGGVTLNSPDGNIMNTQYSFASLIQTASDIWMMVGNHLSHMIVASCSSCTITTDGNFKVFKFNSSDTFVISAGSGIVDSLVVGGGGGGGGTDYGGGGGAGGLIYTTPGLNYTPGSYPVTVGAGGAPQTNGANSVFDPSGANIIAFGGGHGGDAGTSGASGASGGGGSLTGSGAAGTPGQGFAGGSGFNGGSPGGGGGGGAGGSGVSASNNIGGNGGIGLSNSITGSAVFYASGGGGGVVAGGTPGAASAGGGGSGSSSVDGSSGTANTGGGGGGGTGSGPLSSSGGSGVVILRVQYQ